MGTANINYIYSYDAWGRRRNATTWASYTLTDLPIFSRGYTGHEHLDVLGIINMNGRMYDPRLGMFMSADPVIQFPGNPLNYNRYSYVLNNPLKYTDPSGYEFVLNNWEEFLNVVDILWNTNPHGDYGGSWSSSGGINYFENNREAYQAGVDYNNRTNGWGSTEYPNGAHVSTSFSLSTFNRRMSSNQRINSGGSFFNNLSNAYSASVSYNLVANSSYGPDVPPGGRIFGSNTPVISQGISFDATFALPGLGYSIEAGVIGLENKSYRYDKGGQYISHGRAFGYESSIGINYLIVSPKKNYKPSDFSGLGFSTTVNIPYTPLSISYFTNSTPDYPSNTLNDSYYGFKIGVGIGFGFSVIPAGYTSFMNWLPNFSTANYPYRR